MKNKNNENKIILKKSRKLKRKQFEKVPKITQKIKNKVILKKFQKEKERIQKLTKHFEKNCWNDFLEFQEVLMNLKQFFCHLLHFFQSSRAILKEFLETSKNFQESQDF